MIAFYYIILILIFGFFICICIPICVLFCMGRIAEHKRLHRSRRRQPVPVLSVQQSTNASTSVNAALPHSDIPQAPPSVPPSPQPILPSYTVCVASANTSTADTQPSTCTTISTSDLVSAPPPSYSDAISNKDYSTIIVACH